MSKKRILTLILSFVLCLMMVLPVSAAHPPRMVDDADLISDSDEKALTKKLDAISEKHQVDVAIVTVDSLGGKRPMDFADDYFDYNGYGLGANRDGIILVIAMNSRDYWMSTRGYAITAFTDKGIEYISDKFVSYLSDGDYAEAFNTYAELCDKFITEAKQGKPYDVGNMPKDPFNFGVALIISIVVGLIIGLVIAQSAKSQLKTVRANNTAQSYVRKGSLNITRQGDIFLYRNVSRTEIETSSNSGGGSSTHTSSSGATHGGGGGKF